MLVFLKVFFEKVDNLQTTKNYDKLPSMQRVQEAASLIEIKDYMYYYWGHFHNEFMISSYHHNQIFD